MDTTSTDLISYLLCRGSASSFELPLFIILKKKWHQKKWKGEAFGYLLPSLKLKVYIKTRKHNTVVWKTISHVKMSLSRITVCKIHKTNKQNPEKPQLVRRQKGYQSIDHKLNLFSFYFLRITRIRQHDVHTLHESPIYTTFYFLNFFSSVRNFNLVVDKTAELSTSLWCSIWAVF